MEGDSLSDEVDLVHDREGLEIYGGRAVWQELIHAHRRDHTKECTVTNYDINGAHVTIWPYGINPRQSSYGSVMLVNGSLRRLAASAHGEHVNRHNQTCIQYSDVALAWCEFVI